MSDLDKLSKKFDQLAKLIDTRELVTKIAVAAKGDVDKEIISDLGTDRKFSGWKPVLKSGFSLISDHEADLRPRPSGPFSVLDGGRKAGLTLPKRRASKTFATPWGPRTFLKSNPMNLGATKGKHTWERARTKIEQESPKRIQVEMRNILGQVFGGG